MRERARGYADAVVEESAVADGLDALASELAAVRGVLDTSDELRRALSDPGVATHARRGVASDLLRDRIGTDAARLVDFAIEVGRAPDLVEDLDWLVTRADAARDGLHAVGVTTLGHRSALERTEGYATAVLERVRTDGLLGEVEDELFRFERVIDASPELHTALTSRDVPAAARAGLVNDLLAGKVSSATARLAAYATRVGRPRDYPELLEALVARVAAETQRRIAEVRAARELSDAQQRRLADALSRIVGQRVEVRVIVDPSVLGGFVASIGDTVVDGSTRHRLELLKERLVLSEATSTT